MAFTSAFPQRPDPFAKNNVDRTLSFEGSFQSEGHSPLIGSEDPFETLEEVNTLTADVEPSSDLFDEDPQSKFTDEVEPAATSTPELSKPTDSTNPFEEEETSEVTCNKESQLIEEVASKSDE